jgi:hypothetical protein
VRGFFSGVAALLAAVILPVAITAVWTAERVTDTDGYVAAVGPLADDEDVQDALIDRLEAYAVQVVGLDRLGASQQQVARQVIRAAVRRVVTDPSFRPIWEEANRQGHAEMLRTLRADRAGEVAAIDLSVPFDAVLDSMREEGLPVGDIAAPGLVFTPDHSQLRVAQEGYQALEAARIWLPVAWVVLVVLTLVIAQRRRLALALLAAASLISVALLWPVSNGIRAIALDSVQETDRELGEAIWDSVTASLDRSILVAVIIAAGTLLVVAVLGLIGPRSYRGVRNRHTFVTSDPHPGP